MRGWIEGEKRDAEERARERREEKCMYLVQPLCCSLKVKERQYICIFIYRTRERKERN